MASIPGAHDGGRSSELASPLVTMEGSGWGGEKAK